MHLKRSHGSIQLLFVITIVVARGRRILIRNTVLQLDLHLEEVGKRVETLLVADVIAKEDGVAVQQHLLFENVATDIYYRQVHHPIKTVARIDHVHILLEGIDDGRLVFIEVALSVDEAVS